MAASDMARVAEVPVSVDWSDSPFMAYIRYGERSEDAAREFCARALPATPRDDCVGPVASALRDRAAVSLRERGAQASHEVELAVSGQDAVFRVLDGQHADDAVQLFCGSWNLAGPEDGCIDALASHLGRDHAGPMSGQEGADAAGHMTGDTATSRAGSKDPTVTEQVVAPPQLTDDWLAEQRKKRKEKKHAEQLTEQRLSELPSASSLMPGTLTHLGVPEFAVCIVVLFGLFAVARRRTSHPEAPTAGSAWGSTHGSIHHDGKKSKRATEVRGLKQIAVTGENTSRKANGVKDKSGPAASPRDNGKALAVSSVVVSKTSYSVCTCGGGTLSSSSLSLELDRLKQQLAVERRANDRALCDAQRKAAAAEDRASKAEADAERWRSSASTARQQAPPPPQVSQPTRPPSSSGPSARQATSAAAPGVGLRPDSGWLGGPGGRVAPPQTLATAPAKIPPKPAAPGDSAPALTASMFPRLAPGVTGFWSAPTLVPQHSLRQHLQHQQQQVQVQSKRPPPSLWAATVPGSSSAVAHRAAPATASQPSSQPTQPTRRNVAAAKEPLRPQPQPGRQCEDNDEALQAIWVARARSALPPGIAAGDVDGVVLLHLLGLLGEEGAAGGGSDDAETLHLEEYLEELLLGDSSCQHSNDGEQGGGGKQRQGFSAAAAVAGLRAVALERARALSLKPLLLRRDTGAADDGAALAAAAAAVNVNDDDADAIDADLDSDGDDDNGTPVGALRAAFPELSNHAEFLLRCGGDVDAAADAILGLMALEVASGEGPEAATTEVAAESSPRVRRLTAGERAALLARYDLVARVQDPATQWRGEARLLLPPPSGSDLKIRWRDSKVENRKGERFVPHAPKETSTMIAATSVNLAWVRRKRKGGVGGGKIS